MSTQNCNKLYIITLKWNRSNLLSRCDMTAFLTSPPASWNKRIISNGASGCLPEWKLTGQPSSSWTSPVAWIALFSNSAVKKLSEYFMKINYMQCQKHVIYFVMSSNLAHHEEANCFQPHQWSHTWHHDDLHIVLWVQLASNCTWFPVIEPACSGAVHWQDSNLVQRDCQITLQ
jgi:hypothetical protein